MKSKRSAWLDAAQRKQENCVFLIRLNWPFECATAWVNKSLPPPFQDMRVIRLNISLNVWNLYSAFYCQWQISQKITCIASCQREKIRRVLFLQCTPVYLHSFNSPSNMLLIFLPLITSLFLVFLCLTVTLQALIQKTKHATWLHFVWWRQLPWIQQHGCGVFPLWITHPHTPTLTNTAFPKTQMGEELISDLISLGFFGGDTVFYVFLTDRKVVLVALLSMCAFM